MNKYFLLLIYLLLGTSVMSEEREVIFKELPAESKAQLDKQRAFVKSLVKRINSKELIAKTSSDFVILQEIVNRGIISKNETWELQALGVVFGDALIDYIPGLSWQQVTDEFGTDAVLRYKETSVQFGVLTMISKRVEDGEQVDVEHIANWLQDFIKNKAHEYK